MLSWYVEDFEYNYKYVEILIQVVCLLLNCDVSGVYKCLLGYL